MAKKSNPALIFAGVGFVGVIALLMLQKRTPKNAIEKRSFPTLGDDGTYKVGEEVEVQRFAWDGETDASDYLDAFSLDGAPEAKLSAGTYKNAEGKDDMVLTVTFKKPFSARTITTTIQGVVLDYTNVSATL